MDLFAHRFGIFLRLDLFRLLTLDLRTDQIMSNALKALPHTAQ